MSGEREEMQARLITPGDRLGSDSAEISSTRSRMYKVIDPHLSDKSYCIQSEKQNQSL